MSTSKLAAIECVFPCPESQVCQITNNYVRCVPNTSNAMWILQNADSVPQYQGTLSTAGNACMSAPQPILKDASHLSTNSSETTITWPPTTIVYDTYYGNCVNGLYCDRAGICVNQLDRGQVCESSNQCKLSDSECISNTCESSAKDSSNDNNSTSHSDTSYNTIHIIAAIIGVTIFIALILGIYFFIRRRRQKRQAKQQQELAQITEQEPPTIKEQLVHLDHSISTKMIVASRSNSSSSTYVSTCSHVNHQVTTMLHPDYEAHFTTTEEPNNYLALPEMDLSDADRQRSRSGSSSHQRGHSSSGSFTLQQDGTPSMQQQQLQYELQRQFQQQHQPPPPPYCP